MVNVQRRAEHSVRVNATSTPTTKSPSTRRVRNPHSPNAGTIMTANRRDTGPDKTYFPKKGQDHQEDFAENGAC